MTEPDANPLEYAPAPESATVAALRERYRPFIDGEFTDGTGAVFSSVNPATGEPLAEITGSAESDVDRAVAAADEAFRRRWAAISGTDRAKYLFRIARLLQERSRELAVLETLDTGKPVRQATEFDLPNAAAWFLHYAGWADKLDHAGFGPSPEPLGVTGQVIPSNFPLLLLAQRVAPALACGSTVVVKPAERTPLTALVFGELCEQAGIPPGTVNILPGDSGTGASLLAHRGVRHAVFTGSTEVGERVRRGLAGRGKRVTSELGGNGVNIVFADAAPEEAVRGVIEGAFFNQGRVRCAGSRLLVEESAAEEFVARLRDSMAELRVGDPMDRNTDVGALGSTAEVERLSELVERGVAEGASRWTVPATLPRRGDFMAPTLLTDVQQSMSVARTEIFGPVLSVLTFRTAREAVTKADNTPYGLAAGVWSEKGSRALWTARGLRTGVVWANTFHRFDPTAPFGGRGESGNGHVGGAAGLEAYLDV
ncbi:aldehyde dehydrogenase (NAD+) [Actinopolyspora alba]|uniref:Aldehyde dehydrogenase (NAD+) n=1 Tax=Actinopolyspora alba TaxID=673379 RepID=A0A1I1U0P1_9ACTN|nr:aldehyde dehydrogenase family protein [Actinopolyspora alba]SFD62263.1 aldehyde dehydrogenase (NAD+) [Actinopolyspora alba]